MWLFLLTLINLFNYIDRYIVAALVESIKKSELTLSDAQAGLLMTGFIAVYTAASPLFGLLGSRFSRTKVMACGVALWSFATAMGGFAKNFLSLFLARAATGFGEAAYGAVAPAVLSDRYPEHRRGRVFAVFFAAIPVGAALGYAAGGAIGHRFGWRAAFFVAGVPGLALAAALLAMKDRPRANEPTKRAGAYAGLLNNRPYLSAVLGYAAYTFAAGGLAFWMPAFLERVRGVSPEKATVQFGLIVIATGFAGTFAGGWLGDRLLKRRKNAHLWVSGVSMLAAVPFTVLALACRSPAAYLPAMVLAQICLFIPTGPVNSAVAASVAPEKRIAAFAACNFLIHILGDVPSPFIIGALSDAASLEKGVMVVPFAVALSGIIWLAEALKRRDAPAP